MSTCGAILQHWPRQPRLNPPHSASPLLRSCAPNLYPAPDCLLSLPPPSLPIMSASSRIPPIAVPFVSDKAKKVLDLVCHCPASSEELWTSMHACNASLTLFAMVTNPGFSIRSRSLLRRTVSPPTRSSLPSSVKARDDGRLIHPYWRS